MGKTLVTYFSASSGRVTEKVAKEFAQEIGADLFEIAPKAPYTAADINWMNPISRCNKEFRGKKDVPIVGKVENFSDYDNVYIGFPIWYGCAPNIINSFCKQYDWRGHKVYAFATSGGSGIGKTAEKLAPYVEGTEEVKAVLVNSAKELCDWASMQG